MAQVTITIPNTLVPRVRAAIRGKWAAQIYPDPSGRFLTDPVAPLSDAEAFQFVVAEFIRTMLVDWEATQARIAAEQQIAQTAAAANADAGGIK